MSTVHPDETTLLRWVLGELPERRRVTLKKHTGRCRPCRAALNATRHMHERMAATGDGLAFEPGDPFESRRAVSTSASTVSSSQIVLMAMREALGRLDAEKARLVSAINGDPLDAAKKIEFGDVAARLACAHVLEEAASGDPAKELSVFAEALVERLANSSAAKIEDDEGVVPPGQLRALASLVVGQWRLFEGALPGAEVDLAGAWRALGSFEAPEHVIALVEASESLRRSYLGRPIEGRLLAERALETFDRYGLARGLLRARHARAVALYVACKFRDAHRGFRAAMDSKVATQLDQARAVSGAAFCLAARARFHEAAKEYSRARMRLKRKGGQDEQYLLQGEMKAVLGTAGRWHKRRDGLAAFALPEAAGAFSQRRIAVEIVKLAGEQGIEAAKERIHAIEANPNRSFALMYAAQLATPRVSANPATYVALARMLAGWSVSVPPGSISGGQILGDALLFESNSLNFYGQAAEARRVAQKARGVLVEAGDEGFMLAFADYYEGSAAGFAGEFRDASRLLGRALRSFELFGQDYLVGRATAAIATVLQHQDRNASALKMFNAALLLLDPDLDAHAYVQLLANRAYLFLRLGQPDAARAAYAKALEGARRLGLRVAVFTIRYGLASIEMSLGRFEKALLSFQKIAADARREDLPQRALSAELRAAQCLGFLGQRDQMQARVVAIVCEIPDFDAQCDKAIRDLLAMTVEADFSAELVSHVVEYFEARVCDIQKEYWPFVLVRGER